jgi:hypothetical protein
MILVGEVKTLMPANSKCQVIFKHIPDFQFSMSREVFQRIDCQFNKILNLWRPGDDHLLSMSIVQFDDLYNPTILDITLTLTNRQWLPFKDSMERYLLQGMIDKGRSFVEVLRIDAPMDEPLPFLVLKDTNEILTPVYILSKEVNIETCSQIEVLVRQNFGVIWRPEMESFPSLPKKWL